VCTRFNAYKESFLKRITLLRKKRKRGEPIEVVSFGGAHGYCYKNISLPAHRALKRAFGKNVHSQRTYLPFIYPRPKVRQQEVLQKQRAKAALQYAKQVIARRRK